MQPAGLIGGGLFVTRTGRQRVWTVAEAKAHLSEILRLAQAEGPQRIGIRRSFVVVPADAWDNKTNPRKPLGRWLIENMPRGVALEIPGRHSAREVPFSDKDDK